MIIASRPDHKIVRNSSFFKVVPSDIPHHQNVLEDEFDNIPPDEHITLESDNLPTQSPEPDPDIQRRSHCEHRRPRYLDDYKL